MKLFRLSLLAVAVIVIVSCKKTGPEYLPGGETQIQQDLKTMLEQVLATYKQKFPAYPGGLAMQVISKRGSFFVSSGMGTGISNQVHFRAASNTKTFTSAAILLLAQRGKLKIEAKITDTIPGTQMTYLPLTADYQVPFRDEITIWQLLHHRAGIFDISNDKIPDTVSVQVPYKGMNYLEYIMLADRWHTFTFDELVSVVATCRLYSFLPGTNYHYSNTGYSMLGKIIERVSGQTYQQFLTEQIVEPMGLGSSTFPYLGTDIQIPPPLAKGYIYTPDTIMNVTESNISANVAEGNLITTPEDLARFLHLLLRGEGVLLPYWINQVMLTPPPGSTPGGWYGCGIQYALNLGYGHGGSHAGYLSRMVSDPQTDFTAVIFTNAWNLCNENASINEQQYFLLDEACYRAKVIVQ
ncbi:MAG: serine hydrolase [bacterium]